MPEESLLNLNDGSNPEGVWTLLVCDKAADDIGFLRYIHLGFTENICDLPPDVQVVFDGDTNHTVGGLHPTHFVMESSLHTAMTLTWTPTKHPIC